MRPLQSLLLWRATLVWLPASSANGDCGELTRRLRQKNSCTPMCLNIRCRSLRFYNHYFSFKIIFRNYIKFGIVYQPHGSSSETLCCRSYYLTLVGVWLPMLQRSVLELHCAVVNSFFASAFALPRFTGVNCKRSARERNLFHFLRWCLRLRLHLRWCSSHVHLAFAFAFAWHVWTRLKGTLSISNKDDQ